MIHFYISGSFQEINYNVTLRRIKHEQNLYNLCSDRTLRETALHYYLSACIRDTYTNKMLYLTLSRLNELYVRYLLCYAISTTKRDIVISFVHDLDRSVDTTCAYRYTNLSFFSFFQNELLRCSLPAHGVERGLDKAPHGRQLPGQPRAERGSRQRQPYKVPQRRGDKTIAGS